MGSTVRDYSIILGLNEITDFLIESGVDLNKKDKKGNTFFAISIPNTVIFIMSPQSFE